jgi:hypothetical protein
MRSQGERSAALVREARLRGWILVAAQAALLGVLVVVPRVTLCRPRRPCAWSGFEQVAGE